MNKRGPLLGGQSITLDKLKLFANEDTTVKGSGGVKEKKEEKKGECPKNVRQNSTVFEADFRDQNLDDLPPVIFILLKDLRRLHLDNNNLRSLSEDITNFSSSLHQLTISHNLLSSLPSSLSLLSSLVLLDARENQLMGLPEGMGGGEEGGMSLRHVLLGGNLIEELEGGNKNGCVLPTTVEYVDLQKNKLGSLPVGMGKYKKLFVLKLSANLLPSLPEDFGKIKKLRELDLSDNLLCDLPPSFSELKHLRDLKLSKNKFTTFPPSLFALPSLTTLDFSHNTTEELPPQISSITTLKSLSLANNQLSSLPPEFIALSRLTRLDLSNNLLSSLPPNFGASLPHLAFLSLFGNPMAVSKTIMTSPDILNLQGLRTVVLEGQQAYHVRKWRNQYILAPAKTPRGHEGGAQRRKGSWINAGVQQAGLEGGEKGEGEEGKAKKGFKSLFQNKKEGKKGEKKGEDTLPVPRSRTPNPPQSPGRLRSPSAASTYSRPRSPSLSAHSPRRPMSPPFDPSVCRPRSPSVSHSPNRPREREGDIVLSPSRSKSRSPSSPWVSPSSSRPMTSPKRQEITLSPCRSPSPQPLSPVPAPSSPSSTNKNNLLLTLGLPPPDSSLRDNPSPPPPPRVSLSLENLDKIGENPEIVPEKPPRKKEVQGQTETKEKKEDPIVGVHENFGLGGLDQFIEKYGQTSDSFGQFGDNFGTLTFNIPADLALPLFSVGAEGGAEIEKEEEGVKLFVDFASVESLNKNGLRRGKKEMTRVGPNKKAYMMEDRQTCLPTLGGDQSKAMFCVFDGHSGSKAAEECVSLLPGIFLRCCDEFPDPLDCGQILHETFVQTDAELPTDTCEYQGCTGTVCYLWHHEGSRHLQVANVGDSFAFLVKENGDVIPLTSEHSLLISSERERIQAMGVELYEGQTRVGGLKVTRALGDLFTKQISSGVIPDPYVCPPITLSEGEGAFLVVASDGLWDVISGKRAGELILNNVKLSTQQIANILLKTAVGSSKCHDNVTVIVVRL